MSTTDAYVSAQQTAADQITTLITALAAHHDATPADGKDWGHVGDINHVNELLAESIGFLTGANEAVTP
jgi:hypothetical protein